MARTMRHFHGASRKAKEVPKGTSEGQEPVPALAVVGWVYGVGVPKNVVAGSPMA
jgi:hypothetical protein